MVGIICHPAQVEIIGSNDLPKTGGVGGSDPSVPTGSLGICMYHV